MDAQATSRFIRDLYAAYETGDRTVQEAGLADDFRFSSPYDDAIDRAAYFARCWPNHESIKAIHIEKLVVDGNDAFVRYTCELKTGGRFRNVEYLTFVGAKLASVEVYFGDPPAGVSKEEYPRFVRMATETWKAKNAHPR